jgi:hypothetical protein
MATPLNIAPSYRRQVVEDSFTPALNGGAGFEVVRAQSRFARWLLPALTFIVFVAMLAANFIR